MKKLLTIATVAMITIFTGCNSHEEVTFTQRIRAAKEVPTYSENLVEFHKDSKKFYMGSGLFGSQPFHVLDTGSVAQRGKCANCHQGALNTQMQKNRPSEVKLSHWDKKLNHGPAGILQCATCHDYDATQPVLKSAMKNNLDFSQVYQTCQTCHNDKVRDWAFGAHGKRVGGWAPPKVIRNCTGCHNPHDPSFKGSIPKAIPQNYNITRGIITDAK
ncbi:MAG: cytochrome c3 family protein [Fibrobacterales bacterium]